MSYCTNQFDEKVLELLKGGAVGFMPSDTIYGLSCLALNEQAVERIHKVKERDSNKPLIVLIGRVSQLEDLGLMTGQAVMLKNHWPGPLTIEFDATNAPNWLHRGGFKFAVRMPDKINLRKLINTVGPIVSTSANLQGENPLSTVKEAKKTFGDKLDFYVDAGDLSNREPSTLAIIENNRFKVIRRGAYVFSTNDN